MSDSKHTPKGWKQHLVDDLTIVDGDGRFVATVVGGDDEDGSGDYNNPDDWPIMEAHARLIAAAPDLFEALEAIVKSLSDQDDEGMIEHAEQMQAARAALAKARGV